MTPDFTTLLTGTNALLAVVVFAICMTLKQVFRSFFNGAVGQRLLPVIPLALGIGLALLGLCTATRWQDRVIVGVIAGFVAAHVYKLGKDTLLGHDLGIDDDPAPTPVPAVSAPVVPVVPAAIPPANTPPDPPAAGGV